MGKVNPFIIYLRHSMIFDNPTTDDLKRILNLKIVEIKSHEERVLLLTEILNLRNSREIDSNYKGGFMDFFSYVEYKIEEEAIVAKPDWTKLYKNLISKCIKDVSANDFNEVMNNHRLPDGKDKIIWTTKKAEAVYFQDYFEFTMKQFNECFIHKDGTKFSKNNRLATPPGQAFTDRLI